jgi:hypothetical protein
LQCREEEDIPLSVVRDMDFMDNGDPTVAPQFSCEACGGAMYPEYYKGVHGYEYRITDVLEDFKDEDNDEELNKGDGY